MTGSASAGDRDGSGALRAACDGSKGGIRGQRRALVGVGAVRAGASGANGRVPHRAYRCESRAYRRGWGDGIAVGVLRACSCDECARVSLLIRLARLKSDRVGRKGRRRALAGPREAAVSESLVMPSFLAAGAAVRCLRTMVDPTVGMVKSARTRLDCGTLRGCPPSMLRPRRRDAFYARVHGTSTQTAKFPQPTSQTAVHGSVKNKNSEI